MDKGIDPQIKIDQLEQRVQAVENRRLESTDFVPKSIKQPAIDGLIVFSGRAADRPTRGDTEIKCWYSTDTSKLSIWNELTDLWKEVTLT